MRLEFKPLCIVHAGLGRHDAPGLALRLHGAGAAGDARQVVHRQRAPHEAVRAPRAAVFALLFLLLFVIVAGVFVCGGEQRGGKSNRPHQNQSQ